ncbi:hypothetical protein [Methylobacterium sp. J-092]|uniref:hypothetical protein n=1 Tax=Methylobacterium sp. J-092 TaxID=2836667 RepID=UPI001FB97093|nr:hypothetical protein [Methylobacterium sp. J-092]MCJ2007055.1 hypothetical protein [Methylobacterium sp. J-092]
MTASQILVSGARDNWTSETARLAMPLLLRCAIDGRKITYGELDAALHATHGRARMPVLPVYGRPAGRIGDVCAALEDEIGRPVPPLNAILVNKSGIPGHGADYYLRRAAGRTRGRLGSSARRSLALATIDAVHAFQGWWEVAEHLGIRIPPSRKSSDEPLTLPAGTGRMPVGPESEAHRQLKERVRLRPSLFRDYGRFPRGVSEAPLLSGDRVDVLFVSGSGFHLAVEVKTSSAPDREHARGVFQALKYRATLRAMLEVEGRLPQADGVLLLGRRPSDAVKAMADRLGVRIFVDA